MTYGVRPIAANHGCRAAQGTGLSTSFGAAFSLVTPENLVAPRMADSRGWPPLTFPTILTPERSTSIPMVIFLSAAQILMVSSDAFARQMRKSGISHQPFTRTVLSTFSVCLFRAE